jgi:hypothetical protein
MIIPAKLRRRSTIRSTEDCSNNWLFLDRLRVEWIEKVEWKVSALWVHPGVGGNSIRKNILRWRDDE